jgi:excisionase family DNA binding protein
MGAIEQLLAEVQALRAELAESRAERRTAYVTIVDFARSHDLGVSTVRAAIRDGRLAATKIGRSVRIAADAVIGKPVRAGEATSAAARRERVLAIVRGGRP